MTSITVKTYFLPLSANAESVMYLEIGGEGHVDLLPVRSDSVQQQRVVHGAVPGGLEAIEGPESGLLDEKPKNINHQSKFKL